MSAERPKGKTAIPLTSEQKEGVLEQILKQWGWKKWNRTH